MVYKKWPEFGFSDNGAPIVPRAPRSIRKRKKLLEDEKLYAFELLASVAGKLLEESEDSASSIVAQLKVHSQEGHENDNKAFKSESFDRGSCYESVFVPETSIPKIKGFQESYIDHSSSLTVSDASNKLNFNMIFGECEEKSSKNSGIGSFSVSAESHLKVEYGSEVHSIDEKEQIGNISVTNVQDPVEGFVNTNSQVNSESSVKLPLYREQCNNVKVGNRDDDEKFSGCNKYSVRRTFRPQPRIGHRRIRKMIASRYWKTAPKLKDYKLYTASEEINTLYRCRKNAIYSRERFQQVPIKKRRITVAYEFQDKSTSISNITGKAADATSGYMKVHSKSKEHHVTVSIKSFKVPELYVEVPESATVGSLKRTVLNAVTAVLGGGVHVGIFFQGNKVRDDNRTLQQEGISQCSNLDNLGFTLEPRLAHLSSTNPKTEPDSLLHDAANLDTQKFVATPLIIKPDITDDNMVIDGAVPQNMALVPVSMKDEAITVVPLNLKPKRSEVLQRRTRRPFSVAEVEALVEAVEKLGTGRWRDVKMCAFENSDHRTYVDLKDKWKTLVHTASISPHQRRGEPVPYELLNRVLWTHSYWSQHQSKGKLQVLEPPRIMDSPVVA